MSAFRDVGVVVRRVKADSPWIDHLWSPAAVLAEAPETPAWTLLENVDGAELFYAGQATLELHVSDTGHYRDNLMGGEPFLWVALRGGDGPLGMELAAVTADPNEGESLFESGLPVVGKAAMPQDVAAWIAAFVDEHHVEREFLKRKRDKSGPDPRKIPGGDRGGHRGPQ